MILHAFILLPLLFSQNSFPDGWNIPTGPDFYREWRDSSQTKYLTFKADFNGDDIVDTAYILEFEKDRNFGIFVELSNYEDPFICLFDAAKDINEALADWNPDPIEESLYGDRSERFTSGLLSYKARYGIRVIGPGTYITACGKGFWDCRPNEPEEIGLKYPAIEFFEYDAGFRVIYYWDKENKKFEEIQVGD